MALKIKISTSYLTKNTLQEIPGPTKNDLQGVIKLQVDGENRKMDTDTATPGTFTALGLTLILRRLYSRHAECLYSVEPPPTDMQEAPPRSADTRQGAGGGGGGGGGDTRRLLAGRETVNHRCRCGSHSSAPGCPASTHPRCFSFKYLAHLGAFEASVSESAPPNGQRENNSQTLPVLQDDTELQLTRRFRDCFISSILISKFLKHCS